MVDPDPRVGRRVGHFRLVRRLGAGGMGVVYRAVDENLRREVAIKVLPDTSVGVPERRARFLREARAAAAVTHPCIAAVHAIEEGDDDAVYLVMELVSGRTLRDVLAQGPLPEGEAVRIATEIARGLARAHEAGIAHRDLKPENVMIDAEGDVKILDFGLAKLFAVDAEPAVPPATANASVLTQEGRILGTPEYMAPEQARGMSDVDARADVHALGVILFEMLTGRRPFLGATALGTIAAVLTEPAPPLDGVAPWLAALVERCLAKSRDDRPSNGRALVQMLRAAGDASARERSSGPGALTTPAATPTAALAATLAAPLPVATPAPRRRWWIVPAALACLAAMVAVVRTSSDDETVSDPTDPPTPSPDVDTASRSRDDQALPLLSATPIQLPSARTLHDATMMAGGESVGVILGDAVEIRSFDGLVRRTVTLPEGMSPTRIHATFDGRVVVTGTLGDTRAVVLGGPDSEPRVLRTGAVIGAALAPDGATLAVLEPSALFFAPVTGGTGRSVPIAGATETTPVWAPDGRAVVVSVTTPSASLLYISLDGSTTSLVPARIQGSLGPHAAFLDAMTLVVALADPTITGAELCRVGLAPPHDTRCFARLPLMEPGTVSIDPTGRRALLLTRSIDTVVRVGRLDGADLVDVRTLDIGEGNHRTFGWLDEETLLVGSPESGHWALSAVPIDGAAPRVFATTLDHDLTYPVRAPDGDGWYAFRVGRERDAGDLVSVTVVRLRDGGIAETVWDEGERTAPTYVARPPPLTGWLTCGRGRCAVGGMRGGQMVAQRVETGADLPLPARSVNALGRMSADGSRLWIGIGPDVVALDPDSGEEVARLRTDHDGSVQYIDLALDGTLYVSTLEGAARRILRIEPDGQTRVLQASPSLFYGGIAVSPESHHLAWIERPIFNEDARVFDVPAD